MTKNRLQVLIPAIILLTAFTTPLLAEERPIQLSLFNPVQLFPEGDSVKGVRLNFLYGKNTNVTGLDWGLVNHTTSGKSIGWQTGLVGLVEADFTGFQDNFVNVVKGNFLGVQWGAVNYSRSAQGIQLGWVNYAGNLNGIQLGLINIIDQGGFFPFFPFVNWSL